MYLITNLIIIVMKTGALLSSIAIDMVILSKFAGKPVNANSNGIILGFIATFLVSSLVYLAIL